MPALRTAPAPDANAVGSLPEIRDVPLDAALALFHQGTLLRPRSLLPALRVNVFPAGAFCLMWQLHAADRVPAVRIRGSHSLLSLGLPRLPRPWRSSHGNPPPGTLSAAANRGRPCGHSAPGCCMRTNSTTTSTLQDSHEKTLCFPGTPRHSTGIPDLLCRFHLLAAVGRKPLDGRYALLCSRISRSKVRSQLRALGHPESASSAATDRRCSRTLTRAA